MCFSSYKHLFRGKHPIPLRPSSNTVLTMVGIWFAVLVAAFIATGVLTQLGWEFHPDAGGETRAAAQTVADGLAPRSDYETVAAAQSSAQACKGSSAAISARPCPVSRYPPASWPTMPSSRSSLSRVFSEPGLVSHAA